MTAHLLTDEQRVAAGLEPNPKPDENAERMARVAAKHDDDNAQAIAKHRKRIERTIYRGRDVLSIPKPPALVADLLDMRSLAILYGASGSGKSFVALDIALRVAAGLPWHFGKETRQGPVLYVVAEGSGDIGARVDAWLAQFLVEPPIDECLFVTMPVNLYATDGEVAALVDIVRDGQFALVVIDTLARSMNGGDENSAKDAALVIAAADAVRDASGACVLLVHHSGYDATHARGSTAFRGACDVELEVKTSDDLVILTDKKQKTRARSKPWFLKREDRGSSCVIVEAHDAPGGMTESMLDTLAALRDHDDGAGLTSAAWELCAECGTGRTFRRHKADLCKADLVTFTGKGNSARYRAVSSEDQT